MKNKILWAITMFAAWELCFGICTLDSEFIAPSLIRMCFGGAWLFGVGKANNWFMEVGAKRDSR